MLLTIDRTHPLQYLVTTQSVTLSYLIEEISQTLTFSSYTCLAVIRPRDGMSWPQPIHFDEQEVILAVENSSHHIDKCDIWFHGFSLR